MAQDSYGNIIRTNVPSGGNLEYGIVSAPNGGVNSGGFPNPNSTDPNQRLLARYWALKASAPTGQSDTYGNPIGPQTGSSSWYGSPQAIELAQVYSTLVQNGTIPKDSAGDNIVDKVGNYAAPIAMGVLSGGALGAFSGAVGAGSSATTAGTGLTGSGLGGAAGAVGGAAPVAGGGLAGGVGATGVGAGVGSGAVAGAIPAATSGLATGVGVGAGLGGTGLGSGMTTGLAGGSGSSVAAGGAGSSGMGSILNSVLGTGTTAGAGLTGAGLLGTLGQGALDLYSAGQRQDAANKAASLADPFASQRPQYQAQLAALMANPNSITSNPAYQFRVQQGQQALEHSNAAKGYLGSGNILHDLQTYGQQSASQEYNNQVGILSGLAGGNLSQGYAGNVYGTGANNSLAQQYQGLSQLGTLGTSLLNGMTNNNNSTSGGLV